MNFMVSVKNTEAFHARFMLFQEQGIYFSLGVSQVWMQKEF